ncbi:MAG: competence protein, partial [Rhodovulum sp.]|nr:competence protein [Rhodovulum sp.]
MGSGWLAAQIETQRPHLALWIPVLFAVGIAAYFQVAAEPPGWMLAAIATFLAMGLGTLFRIGPTARILLLALMLPLAGFAVA